MRMKNYVAIIMLFITLCLCPIALSQSFQTDYQAIDKAAKSLFLVDIYGENHTLLGTGSGFVAFDEHAFITNHHVIEGAESLTIHSDQYKSSHTLTELIVCDDFYDIAILKFPDSNQYDPLPLDPNYELFRGQPVTAIGSPKGILNTVSNGNISTFQYYRDGSFDIQFTAPISHGSSGGALFNEEGSVIGLVYAARTDGEALNFAVPIQYVIDLYNNAPKVPQTLSSYNNISITPQATNTPAPKKAASPTLTAPTSVVISTNNKGYPTLSWVAVSGATSYKIYREKLSGQHELIGTVEVTSSQTKMVFTDEKPNWGKISTYYVASSNASTYAKKSKPVTIHVPSNPASTKTPALTPSPTPTLPTGIKDSYKAGSSGKDILTIKERLQELGYYSKDASLGSTYNDTMVERVKLFQKENNLKVTGILDHSTLLILFSKQTIPPTKPHSSPTPTPKKNATVIDSAFSLIIPDNSQCNYSYDNNGNLKCRFQIKNTAQNKTATEFEIYVYTKNASGALLLGKDQHISATTKRKVKPGETVFSDYVTIPNSSSATQVYVAVSKVTYSDGSVIRFPSMSPKYSSWHLK